MKNSPKTLIAVLRWCHSRIVLNPHSNPITTMPAMMPPTTGKMTVSKTSNEFDAVDIRLKKSAIKAFLSPFPAFTLTSAECKGNAQVSAVRPPARAGGCFRGGSDVGSDRYAGTGRRAENGFLVDYSSALKIIPLTEVAMVANPTVAGKQFFLNQYHGANVVSSSQYSCPCAVSLGPKSIR